MGSHLRALELSTDGRICTKARLEAQRLDMLEYAAMPKPARVRVRVIELNPAYVVRVMARIIAEGAVKRAAVHELDFARAGIDAMLARRHYAAALARARLIEPAINSIERDAA